MSPMRRDGAGSREVGPTWDSLIERQIREAMEAGAFDDLPHRGERLPIEDDKEARRLLGEIDALVERAPRAAPSSRPRLVAEHTLLVEAAGRAIARVNSEAPTDRQHRRPLDATTERDRLERAFEDH